MSYLTREPDETQVGNLKRCTKCGEWKPATLEYFHRHKESKDGVAWACKTCQNARRRLNREANPERNRESCKRWYEANKDAARQYRRDHAETINERKRRYNAEHPESNRNRVKRWQKEHPDKVSARSKRYRAAHPDRLRENNRKWKAENPEKRRAQVNRRRARKLDLPYCFTGDDEVRALEYWHGICPVCGEPLQDLFGERVPHFDHWISLSDPRPDNPGTVPGNMLPTCSKCNLSKFNRDPREWLEDRYGKRKAAQILNRIETYFEAVRS